jgi:anti-sigma factor RsiW
MNCQDAKPLMGPFADGELEAVAVLELEQHLEICPTCGLQWRNLRGLKQAIKQDALFFTTPEELRRRIKAALPLPARAAPPKRVWSWNWLNVSACGAAATCLALLVAVTWTRPSARQRLAVEMVSSHVRSLMAGHMLDVASSDQHTVKPWFNGKLDFSPPVKDLAAREFPLIGGRLDYFGGRAVAALVFQRHQHIINLFVWPVREPDASPTLRSSGRGYHIIHWSESGMTCWAVSDLNEKELMEFAQDFRAEIPSPILPGSD